MITPATSIQIPRRISQAVKLMAMPMIIGMQTVGWFWATWAEVYRPARQGGQL